MDRLQRDTKIVMNLVDGNSWEVQDRNGNTLINHEEDYFIYMANVNLKKGGTITGKYLGDITVGSPMQDSHCKNAEVKEDGFYVDGVKTKTAKMVAVNNKTGVIIIISSR